ncbi:MAG TPA: hypothetical protein VEG60_25120 [Candidatus Binatia bacterium]|nr:hypothetical protein [Candidatus Binatia bacterium]
MGDFTFYLGTHRTNWLGLLDIPLCVSRRQLARRRSFPRARAPWVLDSGGFSELHLAGGWSLSPVDYAREVRRYRDEIGRLVWAAPQDWMCEEQALKKTGLTVAEHKRRTVENYLELRQIAPDLPFIPVLQGDTVDDYRWHAHAYLSAGVDLFNIPVVGLGSVCRRQHTKAVIEIVQALQPLKLHGFGVKTEGLSTYAPLLVSSDSLAWSFAARRRPILLPSCVGHKNCANCLKWALLWRERLLEGVGY